jgi:hypothetical protein
MEMFLKIFVGQVYVKGGERLNVKTLIRPGLEPETASSVPVREAGNKGRRGIHVLLCELPEIKP